MEQSVKIPISAGVVLEGDLRIPSRTTSGTTEGEGAPKGLVLFAHGSGSSRFSPRNRYVAQVLNDAGIATLLVDLLTPAEEAIDERTRHLRFDLELLASRLQAVLEWLGSNPNTSSMQVGVFGASTGGGAALILAARERDRVKAVVSRGGRPDLAGSPNLNRVIAPTLCLVGGNDDVVLNLNEKALLKLTNTKHKELKVIPGATHLFEEPGTLEKVAREARDWFLKYLDSGSTITSGIRSR